MKKHFQFVVVFHSITANGRVLGEVAEPEAKLEY